MDRKNAYGGDDFQNQVVGFIPLFPPIRDPSKEPNTGHGGPPQPSGSNGLGFTFLPPIYPPNYQAVRNSAVTDRHILLVAEELLNEVFLEELLDCVKDILINGINPSVNALVRGITRNNAQINDFAHDLMIEVIDSEVDVECESIVKEFFDDIVVDYKSKLTATTELEKIVDEVVLESIHELYYETVTLTYVQDELTSIVNEVTEEECAKLSLDVLNHYGSRIAFQQYKSMASFAADYILDTCSMDALLPDSLNDIDIAGDMLDGLTFDMLVQQLTAINKAFDDSNCLPMQWFLRTLINNVMLEKSLNDLTDELDLLALAE